MIPYSRIALGRERKSFQESFRLLQIRGNNPVLHRSFIMAFFPLLALLSAFFYLHRRETIDLIQAIFLTFSTGSFYISFYVLPRLKYQQVKLLREEGSVIEFYGDYIVEHVLGPSVRGYYTYHDTTVQNVFYSKLGFFIVFLNRTCLALPMQSLSNDQVNYLNTMFKYRYPGKYFSI